jgi:hypothetical protein
MNYRLNQTKSTHAMTNLLNELPEARDEFRGWARECKVYRNQAWRSGVVTHRSTTGALQEYVTYQMPNGRVYRVAIDMISEQHNNTLKVSNKDLSC